MKDHSRQNAIHMIAGETVWGFIPGLISPVTVMTVLLLKFDAGTRMIGSIGAIESAGILLPQLLGIYLFPPGRSRKKRIILWHIFAIAPFFLLIGVLCSVSSRLSAAQFRWTLIALFGVHIAAGGIVMAAWTDWIASLFKKNIRGTVMGLVTCFGSITGAIGAFAAGWCINNIEGNSSYAILYYASGTLAIISMLFFWLIREPEANFQKHERQLTTRDYLRRFKTSLADSNFRSFLVGRVLATCGFCIVPFITVYYSSPSGGGLSAATLVKLGAAITIGAATAGFVLGRIGDKHGHRIGILTCAAFQVVALLIVLFSSGLLSGLLTFASIGICVGGAFNSHYNMLFETCPHDHRLSHITIGNLVLGAGTIASPIIAGFIAHHFGLRPLFVISLALSILALAWFIFFVKEPRHLPANPLNEDL